MMACARAVFGEMGGMLSPIRPGHRNTMFRIDAIPHVSPISSDTRIPELDGVRGIAILIVLLFHLFFFPMRFQKWHGLAKLVSMATYPGWLGVDLFFVLSGFLITGLLLDGKHRENALRTFFVRRALRILPLYYLILSVIFVCYRGSTPFVLMGFVYMANVAPLFGIEMIDTPLWSLSVEEHFYLGWPWLVHFAKFRTVVITAALLCVLEPVVRLLAFPRDVYFLSWYRLDGLAWGALIACLVRSRHFNRATVLRVAGIAVAVGVIGGCAGGPFGLWHREHRLGSALQFAPAQLIFFSTVLLAVAFRGTMATRTLRFRWLRWAGDLSYCLYITHMLLASAYDHVFRTAVTFPQFVIRAVAVLTTTFLVAIVSRKFLELPARRCWIYFVPQESRAVAVH
jgi:peptidoglycan/LPS O-acetylase OafA/YrhL